MSVSVRSITITPKEYPSVTATHGCLSDWWRPAAAGAKHNESLKGKSDKL